MKRSVMAVMIVVMAIISGCGNNFEWFPKDQTTTTASSTQSLGKYVATNQEKNIPSNTDYVYHFPDHGMNSITDPTHRVWFQSATEATATGRRPCLTCNPPTTD